MKYCFTVFAFSLLLLGCNQNPEKRHLTKEEKIARMDSLKADLLQTDVAFSQLSEQKGRNAAFIEYADSDATMLRSFSMPINGLDSIIGMFGKHPDSTVNLSWIPIHADVARSGDLGYTYGTYSIQIKDRDRVGGTYCTVWRKDKSNKWKFILGTGNHGLKPEDNKE